MEERRRALSREMDSHDTYDTRLAKQRASIKWLLSKAYNNRVPENIREPFYRDSEDQEHLKPQIVHNLANAELYCLAFANIYSDPNYHNLNHWGILQTLSRKGIVIPDPSDGPLTETVLIQTTPIKLGAHIAVIEASMALYAKEVVSPDRVVAAIHRFTQGQVTPDLPADAESGLLLWVNHSQQALIQRIQVERTDIKPPEFPPIKDFKCLCDGAGLAALIAFYCPEDLSWTEIKVSYLPTVSDSIHNLCLVHDFSHHSLPHTVCHMMPEDVTYLRGNMKQNLLVLLADLFNVLEIHPVKCVRFPGSERNRDLSKPIAVVTTGIRRSISSSQPESYLSSRASPDSLDRTLDDRHSEDSFVVHRNRGVPTLSSVGNEDPLIPARLRPNKERNNHDSKSDERGELNKAAGKPSNWEDTRRSSYAGRRSRRNSLTEESQLTLENFGGSQENLHFLGRNPDKEPAVHVSGRREYSPSPSNLPVRTSALECRSSGVELIFAENEHTNTYTPRREQQQFKSNSPSPIPPAVPIRSSQQDARSNAIDLIFADNGYGIEKHDEEKEASLKKAKHSKQMSEVPVHNNTDNSPDLSKIIYNESIEDENSKPFKSSFLSKANGSEKKTTTFAVLPNTTTWQQQSTHVTNNYNNGQDTHLGESATNIQQLHNIKLKLEEKRRSIENEKRKMELIMNKQRQKVGKAAFLQAVTKNKIKSPDKEKNEFLNDTSQKPVVLQETHDEHNWSSPYVEERKTTPDSENIDLDLYQNSIAQMNSSLKDIEADMQRLASQQTQLQGLDYNDSKFSQQLKELANQQQKQMATLVNQQQQMQSFANQIQGLVNTTTRSSPISLSQLQTQPSPPPHGQFFLHDPSSHRRTWSQPEKTDRNVPSFTLHEPRLQNGSFQSPTPTPRTNSIPPRPTPPPKPNIPPRQSMYHAPIPAPSADDMEPQSISFIGDSRDEVDDLTMGVSHINITSGSKTYRIPSPTRPSLNRFVNNSYSHKKEEIKPVVPEQVPEKGFYISFDEEPKRPKPPLRAKRSPKKERFATQTIEKPFEVRKDYESIIYSPPVDDSKYRQYSMRNESPVIQKRVEPVSEPSPGIGLVIESKTDPNTLDEMEKKKEKILLLSLQRRQQQEELKARKELESQQRREIEKMKEEDRARKKEEEKARRAAILEQYKLKKAIEEAEKEGKIIDKADLMKLTMPTMPKMRTKTGSTARPRPKTIHVESSGLDGVLLTPSKGKKGSTSNLADRSRDSAFATRPLRRDQYRGSQDSLSSRGPTSLFRDSPSDDGRGTSPSTQLGRRGSYKTSRDTSEPPSQTRGRSKYSTYQSLSRGRKSNSLMNLSGSSSEQDSMLYRYGDTDSGLGRATPPRRAPSPGMTSGRHLTSPSGPGSLPPGLISKRRVFDDGSSDISSNASSMMEYTGPRLYRQPATKSNRGIMLNAVEYCVFPGVVNRDAKQRVLEEIQRSESKHFLILFRDAGCQFRALYSFCPDTEEVIKLYGTGPKQVNDRMFDKFFKYNSGGKCFSQVHTKHLTVTIDAFTIHNSLWQGKKVNLPSKKDMALVI